MTPITLPILITIAVIGIIAIVLVKLFYKDEEEDDLSKELPSVVNKHWQEPSMKNHDEDETSEDYSFVSKSWKEPMEEKKELKSGVAAKVFQEPMDSKHQNIISNDHQNNETTLNTTENNVSTDDSYNEEGVSKNDMINDIDNNNNVDSSDDSRFKDNQFEEGSNKVYQKNSGFEETENENFRTSKQEYPTVTTEYITPKKYYSSSLEEYENKSREYLKEDSDNENLDKINDVNSNSLSENYNPYGEKDYSKDLKGLEMGEQVFIGGKNYVLEVGKDIIFIYNGETYSSQILEIKHENIRVKYRSQEKWISFSDIKKVF